MNVGAPSTAARSLTGSGCVTSRKLRRKFSGEASIATSTSGLDVVTSTTFSSVNGGFQNLSRLSTEALFKLPNDVVSALSRRADAIKKKLASLGPDYSEVGRIAIYGRNSLKGRKAALTRREYWSGRGALP